MSNLKSKVHWIDEWKNHAAQPVDNESRHRRLDILKPQIASQPPPDFLTDLSDDRSRGHRIPRRNPDYRPSIPERVRDWCQEELSFSMNKISMFGLVFGLMILGSLFFIGGFLTAYSLYSSQPTPDPYENTWAMANQPQSQHPYPASHSRHHMGEAVIGSRIHHETSRLESRIEGGTLRKLASAAPLPLRPFVSSAERQVSSHVRGQISHAQHWPSSRSVHQHNPYTTERSQQPARNYPYQAPSSSSLPSRTPAYNEAAPQQNYGHPISPPPSSSYSDVYRQPSSPERLPPQYEHEDAWKEAWIQEQRLPENAPYS